MTQRSAEEVLKEARKLIGVETKPRQALYPVEHDPIRRFCHMTNDNNPLFLDPEVSKTFAELSREEKFERSHRGHAWRTLLDWIAAQP